MIQTLDFDTNSGQNWVFSLIVQSIPTFSVFFIPVFWENVFIIHYKQTAYKNIKESHTDLVINYQKTPELCRKSIKYEETMEGNNIKDFMQEWFEQFMGRFDRLDKFIEIMTSRHNILNGERLLDNHDLCKLLNVSKRTLQRYRSNGYIPYQTIYHKTYYKESDVEKFIHDHFSKNDSDKEET